MVRALVALFMALAPLTACKTTEEAREIGLFESNVYFDGPVTFITERRRYEAGTRTVEVYGHPGGYFTLVRLRGKYAGYSSKVSFEERLVGDMSPADGGPIASASEVVHFQEGNRHLFLLPVKREKADCVGFILALKSLVHGATIGEHYQYVEEDDTAWAPYTIRGETCYPAGANSENELIRIQRDFVGRLTMIEGLDVGASDLERLGRSIAARQGPESVPMRVSWEAAGPAFCGKIDLRAKHSTGYFEARSGPLSLDCWGEYFIETYGDGTSPLAGFWRAGCEDGRIASGRFRETAHYAGIGNGVDDRSREITFEYGPDVTCPQP